MLSVIILTYNSSEFIKPCLDSILSQDYKDLEIIVVDNGSQDDSVGYLRNNYHQIIRLIENKENKGASQARNQGIQNATGEWILVLDCDVVLENDFFNNLFHSVKAAKQSVGIFQPKVLNMDKKTIYTCGIYLSSLKRFYDIGKGRNDNRKFKSPKYIFGASSAAALYNRQMLEEIKEITGYFDERFFFLAEDVDISWRAQRNNWKVLYCPAAVCYHHGNSSQFSRKMRQYLCWRNRGLFLKKYEFNKFGLFLSLLFYDTPRLFFLLFANSYVRKNLLGIN